MRYDAFVALMVALFFRCCGDLSEKQGVSLVNYVLFNRRDTNVVGPAATLERFQWAAWSWERLPGSRKDRLVRKIFRSDPSSAFCCFMDICL